MRRQDGCGRRARQGRRRLAGLLLAMACLGITGRNAWAADEETLATFHAQVDMARQVTLACAAAAAGCRVEQVPADARVTDGASGSFRASWQWLRTALLAARKADARSRNSMMLTAEDRLGELSAEAAAPARATDITDFRAARTAANRVLSRDEFRAAGGPGWLERQLARLQAWVSLLFLGVAALGQHNPWIAPLIEFGCFGLAVAGLLLYVRRSLARQSLRIALNDVAIARRDTGRDAADWARLAEERAAAADWREAVHCLYWAAIGSLEARRAWRTNPTRTPREYLPLLRAGSEPQRLLRELTRRFERVWYGQGSGGEAEYRGARETFDAIKAADLRGEVSNLRTSKGPSAAAGLA